LGWRPVAALLASLVSMPLAAMDPGIGETAAPASQPEAHSAPASAHPEGSGAEGSGSEGSGAEGSGERVPGSHAAGVGPAAPPPWPPPDLTCRVPLVTVPYRFEHLRTLVLDPGHGGADGGTVGVAGIPEKLVVLQITRMLHDRLLEIDPGLRIVMTRDADVDVSLDERARIANLAGADAFVSLHLNAAPRAEVEGVETLTLLPLGTIPGETVPGREVEGPALPVAPVGVRGDLTAAIVADLRRAGASAVALVLAESVQRAVLQTTGAFDREVKQGRFRVLRGLSMPGIVVESGFLSHEVEGRKLVTSDWQACVIQGIVAGLVTWDGWMHSGELPVASPVAAGTSPPQAQQGVAP
jgi:N-acetylmuramoyl-L-alanine amidase